MSPVGELGAATREGVATATGALPGTRAVGASVRSPRGRPAWQARPLGYQPALDGLRAVAVGLVVAYHLGWSGVGGGYIGVEVFFVLSGWLVCALLVNEHHRTGGIGYRRFWVRRARRLLPGLVVVTAVTVAATSLVEPGRLAQVRGHTVAALAYHLNWRLLLDERSYFAAAGGRSPLEHLWSLSIEEQFYLVFPLLCGGVLVRFHRRAAVAVALAGAVAATVLRFALLAPGADPSRVYFGTDTRAAGLLLGVAVGLFWTPNRLRPHDDAWFVRLLDGVALAGAAVLGWYAFGLDEHQAVAFEGGFTAVQVATIALVAVAVYPAPTRAVRLLSTPPLRWVGQRSYGIYLIHWPIIVLSSDAPGEQPESPARVAAQLALVLALAALSYSFVEWPVRRHGLVATVGRARAQLAASVAGRPAVAAAVLVGVVLAMAATAGVTRDLVTASTPEPAQPSAAVVTVDTTAPPAPGPVPPAESPPPAPPPPPPGAAFASTTAVGDSVLVGATPALVARMGPALGVDAVIGRQMAEADEVVTDLAARGQLGQVVLLHLGNNGPFSAEEIDAVMAAIGPERTVLLVNVAVPRRWEGEVNDQLAAAAARHPNAVLVDWRSLATGEAGLTRDDGYHLTANGAERYADLVVGQVPRA